MKYFFKLSLLLLSLNQVLAREVIVISYHQRITEAQFAKKTLLENQQIPESLISIQQINPPCTRINDAILQICFDDEGEISFPVARIDTIKQSFKIFRE